MFTRKASPFSREAYEKKQKELEDLKVLIGEPQMQKGDLLVPKEDYEKAEIKGEAERFNFVAPYNLHIRSADLDNRYVYWYADTVGRLFNIVWGYYDRKTSEFVFEGDCKYSSIEQRKRITAALDDEDLGYTQLGYIVNDNLSRVKIQNAFLDLLDGIYQRRPQGVPVSNLNNGQLAFIADMLLIDTITRSYSKAGEQLRKRLTKEQQNNIDLILSIKSPFAVDNNLNPVSLVLDDTQVKTIGKIAEETLEKMVFGFLTLDYDFVKVLNLNGDQVQVVRNMLADFEKVMEINEKYSTSNVSTPCIDPEQCIRKTMENPEFFGVKSDLYNRCMLYYHGEPGFRKSEEYKAPLPVVVPPPLAVLAIVPGKFQEVLMKLDPFLKEISNPLTTKQRQSQILTEIPIAVSEIKELTPDERDQIVLIFTREARGTDLTKTFNQIFDSLDLLSKTGKLDENSLVQLWRELEDNIVKTDITESLRRQLSEFTRQRMESLLVKFRLERERRQLAEEKKLAGKKVGSEFELGSVASLELAKQREQIREAEEAEMLKQAEMETTAHLAKIRQRELELEARKLATKAADEAFLKEAEAEVAQQFRKEEIAAFRKGRDIWEADVEKFQKEQALAKAYKGKTGEYELGSTDYLLELAKEQKL